MSPERSSAGARRARSASQLRSGAGPPASGSQTRAELSGGQTRPGTVAPHRQRGSQSPAESRAERRREPGAAGRLTGQRGRVGRGPAAAQTPRAERKRRAGGGARQAGGGRGFPRRSPLRAGRRDSSAQSWVLGSRSGGRWRLSRAVGAGCAWQWRQVTPWQWRRVSPSFCGPVVLCWASS